MHFSSVVIISLLLYHRGIIYSEASLLREKTRSTERNILEQFFAEMKIHLDKYNPRQVTIIGVSDEQLRQTKSLLEAFPYFLGRNAKEFCTSREFSPNTLIVYFLESLEEVYLTKVTKRLVNCTKNQMYLVLDGIEVNDVDIELILRVAYEQINILPILINKYTNDKGKSLKLYSYAMTADCSRKAELLIDWMPGINIKWLDGWQFRFTREGCPIFIGTRHSPPMMNLAKDAMNGSVKIIGGSDSNIISTIAQKMNSTSFVQEFNRLDAVKDTKSGTIVLSCAAGTTDIGIAQIRPSIRHLNVVDISLPYSQECTVWCVPRIPHWKSNILISEFSGSTWALIGLMFLISFMVEKIVRNSRYLSEENADKSGCWSIILDLIGSTLGNSIVYQPLSIGGKILLMIYICYSMVITTGYKTSLSSILTVENSVSSIVDVEGIIKANLTTGGDVYRLSILKDQREDYKFTPELMERYVIETNVSKALLRVSYDKDFAYLAPIAQLSYHKNLLAEAGEHVSFDVFDECVLNYGTAMLLRRTAFLTERVNLVIQHLANGGFLDYWMNNDSKWSQANFGSARSSQTMKTDEELNTLTRQNFDTIFYIYCVALTFCILIFLGELVVHKFKLVAKIHRLKIFNRFKG